MKLNENELFSLIDRSDEVNFEKNLHEVTEIIEQLNTELDNNPELNSISAPEIGILKRVFILKFENNERKVFSNPMIIKTDDFKLLREKSLITGKEFIIPRHEKIIVAYQDGGGKIESNQFEGFAAQVMEQNINLLDGLLDDYYGLEVTEEFDSASDEEREELLTYYIEQLQEDKASIEEEIESDEDLKRLDEGIKFMTGVATGQVKIEKPEPPALNRRARRWIERLSRRKSKRKHKEDK